MTARPDARGLRVELVQACPAGMAEALRAAGLDVTGLDVTGLAATGRPVRLAAAPGELRAPAPPDGVRLVPVDSPARQAQVDAVRGAVFDEVPDSSRPPGTDPGLGGSVLALCDGLAVAAASWTAVGEATSEIVGVATVPGERQRGIGAAVTGAAAAGAVRGGADLVWLSSGDPAAQRLYRALGFTDVDTADTAPR